MKRLCVLLMCLCGVVRADYLGSWDIDDYLTFCVQTSDATGADTDATGDVTYKVREDETTLWIVDGTMTAFDDPNTTGYYSDRLQLTAASGFEAGKCYNLRVTATVDGVTGSLNHSFQIRAEVNVATIEDLDPTTQLKANGIPPNYISATIFSASLSTINFSPAPTAISTTNPPRTAPISLIITSGEAIGNIYGVIDLSLAGGKWTATLDRYCTGSEAEGDTAYLVWGLADFGYRVTFAGDSNSLSKLLYYMWTGHNASGILTPTYLQNAPRGR